MRLRCLAAAFTSFFDSFGLNICTSCVTPKVIPAKTGLLRIKNGLMLLQHVYDGIASICQGKRHCGLPSRCFDVHVSLV